MSDNHPLTPVLTSILLYELAGEVTYARGLAYAQEGRVQDLMVEDGVLAAVVRGTEPYIVRLDSEKPRLSWDCTCPVGDELRFCKHCVAVGLTWLQTMPDRQEPSAACASPGLEKQKAGQIENPTDRIRSWLERQDAQALREMLLAEVDRNEALRERLLLRALASDSGEDVVRVMREVI